MLFRRDKQELPSKERALKGRMAPSFALPTVHVVTGAAMQGPFDGYQLAMFGLGCFWGAERRFWQQPGVVSTQVGYAGGLTPHPTYEEVCSGLTGHNEVVRVVFDAQRVSYDELLRVFFESHDPTQGMRQGNDVGTQYRSGIYPFDEAQQAQAERAKARYEVVLQQAGYAAITTEIVAAPTFYFAEEYHQQYLAKNPGGYCGLGGTGVRCPG
ncbi:MAG: peptide-methionine (S)-S-oxide reductase MsrA [Myxococcota bacterium]